MKALAIALAFMLSSLVSAHAITQSRLTNQDVIDLVSLGFSDEVVIDKIHATDGAEIETSVSALKALKAAKVSDSVIRAMINARATVTPPSTGLVTSQKSELFTEVGVYIVLNSVMTELQPEIVNWQTGGFVKTHATLGIVKGDVNGKIPGPRSAVQLPVPIDLIVRTTEGTLVTEYQLLHRQREWRLSLPPQTTNAADVP